MLLYVTLDLSLAEMPGAFVFEAADSAETTQVRARAAAETVALPALAADPRVAPSQDPPGEERPTPSVTSANRVMR